MSRVCFRRLIVLIGVVAIFSLALLSCGPAKPAEAARAEEPADESQSEEATTEPPAVLESVIVFLEGDVAVWNDGEWYDADIGNRLLTSDRVRVGAESYCELQLGDLAIVRIQSETEVAIASLSEQGSESQAAIQIAAGTVLTKVRRMAGDERFEVRTQTVTAGVRGTEFSVSTTPAGDTLVAVQTGSVAVAPSDLDLAGLRAKSADSKQAQDLLDQIEAALPVIEAGNEVLLDAEIFESVAEAAAPIVKVVEQAIDQPDKDWNTEVAEAEANIALLGTSLGKSATQTAISDKRRVDLEVMEVSTFKTLSTVQRLAPTRSTTPPAMPEPSAELEPAEEESTGVEPVEAEPVGRASTQTPPARQSAPAQAAAPQATVQTTQERPEREPEPEPEPTPEPTVARVTVQVTPSDAAVEINGQSVGAGGHSADYDIGSRVRVTASRLGFESASRSVTVSAAGTTITLRLDPRPIAGQFSTGTRLPVGAGVAANRIVLTGVDGAVAAYRPDGTRLWQVDTKNNNNNASVPVVFDDYVYFSGTREFVIINAQTGAVVFRRGLESNEVHALGRRIARSGNRVYYPATDRIIEMDAATGRELREFEIPGGSRTTPTVVNGKLLIVDQRGNMLIINATTGRRESSIATGATQPVGVAPVVQNGIAVFGGRQGTVAAIDIAAGRTLWEQETGESIFSDAAVSENAVHVVSQGVLRSFGLRSGNDLHAPIPGVTGLPAVIDNTVFYGTESGILVAMSARTGTTTASVTLGLTPIGRIGVSNGTLFVVGEGGEVWVVQPEGLQVR